MKRGFLLGAIAFVAAVCACGAVALCADTLISGPLTVAAAVCVALATAWPCRRLWARLTGSDNVWLNCGAHTAVLTSLLLCAFYVGNYSGADLATLHPERVVIEKKYTETRYRTRRINRRVTGRGAPYQVYFVELVMPDGRHKTLEVQLRLYNTLRQGDEAEVQLARGLFGVPVIRRDMPITDLGHASLPTP